MLNKLSNINWFLLFSQLSVNEMWLCFKQNLWKVIVEDVPLITIRQQKYKCYVPKNIKHLIYKKKKVWKLYKLTKNPKF